MRIGFTTSFPLEVVLAAGHQAIDLNNIFITGDSVQYVTDAELKGFPRSLCAWIKGMYSTIMQNDIDLVIGIVQGDCSNTHSLMSVLNDHGKVVLSFSFPYERKYEDLNREISKLEDFFEVDRAKTLEVKYSLDKIRKKLVLLDEMTWKEGIVSGAENHYWLVNSSDFNGDPVKFEKDLDSFIQDAQNRAVKRDFLRLGYVGVPPILTDFYRVFEGYGSGIVFNEVQRQFSMPYLSPDLIEQYLLFTYPYTIKERLNDISHEIRNRQLDALVSYTQSFCHRQLDHLLIKKKIEIPVLQIEADQPGPVDARTQLRIESFLEMLRQ